MSNDNTFTECEVVPVVEEGIVFAVTVTYDTDTGEIVSTDFTAVIDVS